MKESVNRFSIIKFIISILIIIIIALAINQLIHIYQISDTYEDNFIGSFEKQGKLYRSHGNLFTFTNNYSGIKRRYYKDFIKDGINESGYHLSYKIPGHDPYNFIIFRESMDNEVFKQKALRIAGEFDSLLTEPYFDDFVESEYQFTFHTLVLLSDKDNKSDSLKYTELFSFLFCAQETFSMMLRTSRKYKAASNDLGFDESDIENEKRLLYEQIKHKLIINKKIIKNGIPKIPSEMELTMIRTSKRILRIFNNIVTFGRYNYNKQDKIIRKIKK